VSCQRDSFSWRDQKGAPTAGVLIREMSPTLSLSDLTMWSATIAASSARTKPAVSRFLHRQHPQPEHPRRLRRRRARVVRLARHARRDRVERRQNSNGYFSTRADSGFVRICTIRGFCDRALNVTLSKRRFFIHASRRRVGPSATGGNISAFSAITTNPTLDVATART
jgi:hypothetical protein